MKKGFLFVISLCFIFTICFITIITSAETLTINEMKEILISKSFSETFLNLSSDESIETLYQNYNNAESLGSSTSTAYLNEQISDGIQTFGTIKNMTFEITASYFKVAGTSNQIQYTLIQIGFFWEKIPLWKKTDGIIVNWDSSVFAYNDNFHSESHNEAIVNNQFYSNDYSSSAPNVLEQGSLGFDVKLANAEHREPDFIYGTAYFQLIPARNPMYYSSSSTAANATAINAQYRHNRNPFISSVGFKIKGVNISFDLSTLTDSTTTSTNFYYTY